jgi:saccharopine dehydrogenase-like NADP-dependent oxidoreductase
VLVLGCGLQGRAVIEDLERRSSVDRIVAADIDVRQSDSYLASIGARKTVAMPLDARDEAQLRSLLSEDIDVAITMLPVSLERRVAEIAIERGINLVTTNYAHELGQLDAVAAAKQVTIMPEAGFDPGIDLVIAGHAISDFDETETLISYGGGVPASECKDANALNYKISWNFASVLRSYWRPARVLVGGKELVAAPGEIFQPAWTHHIRINDLGVFQAFVNGDAVAFAEVLGIRSTMKNTARYSVRWPGHCEFWARMSSLGFLDETSPCDGGLSPREFLRRHLEPRLQYGPAERDMVILRVDVVGRRGGKQSARRFELIDYRDLNTGLLAMNRVVGYPASIVAQMILSKQIEKHGIGSPIRDIPAKQFLDALTARGMSVRETEIDPSECHVPDPSGAVGT